MPFDFDPTNPLDNSIVSSFPANERASRLDIKDSFEIDHTMSTGKHKQVELPERASNPTLVGNSGFLYTKDVAGITELFWENDAGTVQQLTEGGQLKNYVRDTGDTMTGALVMDAATIDLDNVKALRGEIAAGGTWRPLIQRNASNQVEIGDTNHEDLLKADDANGFKVDYTGSGGAKEILHEGNAAIGQAALAVKFTKYADSGDLVFVTNDGTPEVWAHGLTVEPKGFHLYLRNVIAQHGWNGELIGPLAMQWISGQGEGLIAYSDATNITVQFADSYRVQLKSSSISGTITDANWRLVIRAWA